MKKIPWEMEPPFSPLAPLPVALIGCGSVGGEENIITVSWIGTMNSEPGIVYMGLRPSRYSHVLLGEFGIFTVNMPGADLYKEMMLCGTVSGRDIDKWEKTGLGKVYGRTGAPMISECPVNVECDVTGKEEQPSHTVFKAKTIAAYANPGLMEGGRPDWPRINPMSLCFDTIYDMHGRKLGVYRSER